MPFKSKAQRRKFAQLLVEGKISDETYEEWNRSTGGKALPERVGEPRPKKQRSASSRAEAKRGTPTRSGAKRAAAKTAAKGSSGGTGRARPRTGSSRRKSTKRRR